MNLIERPVIPRRSFIFSPGLKPEMYPKALASGTDIVCVELEDGIAPKNKDEARRNMLAMFAEPQADDGVERIVRINCVRSLFGMDDVQSILKTDTPPPAVMLPKVMSPDEIVWLDDLLTERGHDTRLHIIIETNAGLEAVHDIARASDRIDALFFGGVDMAAELRCQNTWESLLYARSRIVHAAASIGIDAIDVPFLDLEDPDGLVCFLDVVGGPLREIWALAVKVRFIPGKFLSLTRCSLLAMKTLREPGGLSMPSKRLIPAWLLSRASSTLLFASG